MGELRQEVACVAHPLIGDRAGVESACPGAVLVRSPEEVIASPDVDAVVITRPTGDASMIHEALLTGKHVLIEAPLASTHSEARELANLAQQRGQVLLVAHTPLFHRGLQAIKEWADKPENGTLQAVNLHSHHPDPPKSSREFWRSVSQQVAALAFILEQLPAELEAHWKRREDTFESARLVACGPETPSIDCELQFSFSSAPSRATQRIEVRTDRGRAVMEQRGIGRSMVRLEEDLDGGPDERAPEDVLRREIRLEDPKRSLCEHFTQCIEERLPPRSDGHFGVNVVAGLERARR